MALHPVSRLTNPFSSLYKLDVALYHAFECGCCKLFTSFEQTVIKKGEFSKRTNISDTQSAVKIN